MKLHELLPTIQNTMVRVFVFDEDGNIVRSMNKPTLGSSFLFNDEYADVLDYEVEFISTHHTREWLCILVALIAKKEYATEYDYLYINEDDHLTEIK